MNYYQAFGLTIAADLALPELLPSAHQIPDIIIQAGAVPHKIDASHTQFLLAIEKVARFHIEQGKKITYAMAPESDSSSLRLFLLGSSLGALLQQRGLIVLHGNAISFNQKEAHIFLGHSGVGKSTQAAYFLKQGAMLLSDDLAAIYFDAAGQPWILPAYPQIKLWQNAADLLQINTENLKRIRPQDAKYAVPINTQFYPQPLPLKEVYELNPEQSSHHELSGMQKLKILLTHSYRPQFLDAMNIRVPYTKQLIQLAQTTLIKQCGRSLL